MTQNPSMRMHVSLFVSDIKSTRRFYDRFFKKDPVKQKSDYLKYELDDPGLVISFLENKSKANGSFGHLGFRVSDKEKLQNYLQAVTANGLLTLEENDTHCCYARQDKFWVTDPDGYSWEVYQFIEDVGQNDTQKEEAITRSCC
ncbi:MAG: glyoxalase/bleomycin resistance/dioxygenase family protein [Bacteroidetes bacterium]|nr:glyoxalase/bleomycin resistance/dioxygenase family protein [Bacteroidota bacterium]